MLLPHLTEWTLSLVTCMHSGVGALKVGFGERQRKDGPVQISGFLHKLAFPSSNHWLWLFALPTVLLK